ncbi:MAG TPA: glycosyltransferase family 39 protein [Patescibacteria group bacterium]|nr:glycosyltransferase family 39 protein [Patescibacteria group bacterium]
MIMFWFVSGILFLLSRLYNIMSLPIFTDEAIYTRWSQIAKLDPNWRFISLTDGKQPLFVWINMIFMKFISDPLLSGRLVSVFAGALTMVGIFFLARELFNRKVAIISVFLYIVYPFALVYDRMALYDSLVAAGAIWSLFFEILLIKKRRLDIALILGMVLGASVLTKTSGFLFIYLLPVSLLLFNWKSEKRNDQLIRWGTLAIVSTGFAYFYYSILRLSPFYHIINEKNAIFVYPLREWLTHPFTFFVSNWSGQFNWLLTYMTLPVLLLIVGSFILNRKNLKEKLLLFSWFIFPFIALALFGKTLYPRFILFMTMPLLILAAYSLSEIYKKIKLAPLILLLFTALMLKSDYFILTDFAKAPIAYSDLQQYILDWPAGVGVKEAVKFFDEKSKSGKIFVATEGTFGLMPYGLEIYLFKNKNVEIKGVWPIEDLPPKEATDASKTKQVYFLFYQPCTQCKMPGDAPQSWPVKKELSFPRVNAGSLTIYSLR